MENPFDIATMKSKNLMLWMENKNPFCSFLAIQYIALAENLHETILAMHNSNFASHMDEESIKVWTHLYKASSYLRKDVIKNILPEMGSSPFTDSQPLRILTKAATGNANQRKRIQQLTQDITEEQVEEQVLATVAAGVESNM